MQLLEFEFAFERIVKTTVQNHFPLDWKEDVITHTLLKELRQYNQNIEISDALYPVEIEWEVYKFHGRRETDHGDIGVLVSYKLPTGSVVEGAGFIEAKLRDRNSTKFIQVRHQQIERILSRSPYSFLMLYDYNPVAVQRTPSAFDIDHPLFHESKLFRRHNGTDVTHAPLLPLRLAAELNQYDDGLYRFCTSPSRQFTRRFFNLHDLDFGESAVQAVKGFPGDLGSPNYVMVIRAATIGQELPERFVPNENLFGSLE